MLDSLGCEFPSITFCKAGFVTMNCLYKELKKLDTKTLINPIKKWGADLNREFSSKELRMAKKTLKVMLNLLSDQGNTNQNNFEIPSYTCKNS